MSQSVFRNKRFNKKKICSVLTEVNDLDEEKQTVFDNMKHDFYAHLSDRQSDREDRHRRAATAIRQQFQSLLMQIPSNIQNLTIEEIYSKGGSIELNDRPNDEPIVSIQIPKSMLSSANDLSQVMSQKKINDAFKEPLSQRMAAIKSASSRKATETTASRVTRSTVKGTVKRGDIFSRQKPLPSTPTEPKVSAEKKSSEKKEEVVLKSLSGTHLKPPRKPNPNEDIITLAFSTSGTPLLVENKIIERINKSN